MERKPPRSILGSRIAKRRLAMGISQTDLARQIGVNPKKLGDMEAGLRPISIDVLAAIADVLDASLDELYWGSARG